MRLKNTACPRCKQELTPCFKDMLPHTPAIVIATAAITGFARIVAKKSILMH